MMKWLSFLYAQFDRETKIYFLGVFILSVLGGVFILINHLFFHFTGYIYIPPMYLLVSPAILAVLIAALWARDLSPRTSFFTRTYAMYFFIFLSLSVMSTGVQFSPFPLIDKYLVAIDNWLGFYSLPVLNWTYAHPWALNIFQYSYYSLGVQIFLLPLLLGLFKDKEGIQTYFLSFLISCIIGMLFYYFFPTAGPTVIFHSPHFWNMQHDTYLKFFEVHHRLLVTTEDGGMIAFPSFHVIWAFLMIYLCRNHRWLFYPLLILNVLVIISTVMLGWHYLTDVFGGLALGILSVYLAHKIERKFFI